MKKLLVIAAMVACGSLAQASELWWTVADSVSVDGGSTEWATARLFSNTTGYNFDGKPEGDAVSLSDMQFFGEIHTDIGNVDELDSATCFYVELYDQAGQSLGKTYVQTSTDLFKNQGAATLQALKDAGAIYSGDPLSPGASPYSGFDKFTTSNVVPEPTSGLLVALGMMLFGLKRKRA